jgi:hypothetical protein
LLSQRFYGKALKILFKQLEEKPNSQANEKIILNVIFIDFSAGMQQNYIEDCQVCCRPNILYIRIDEDTLDIEIDTEYDG